MERSEDIAATARFFDRAIAQFSRAGPVARIRVLDFGCGAGQLVEQLLELGYDAWGCDIALGPAAAKRCGAIGAAPYRFPFDGARASMSS